MLEFKDPDSEMVIQAKWSDEVDLQGWSWKFYQNY